MTQDEIDLLQAHVRRLIVEQRDRDHLRGLGIRMKRAVLKPWEPGFSYPVPERGLFVFHAATEVSDASAEPRRR